MSLFEVRSTPLSLDECVAAVARDDAGGIATFIGVVRDHNQGGTVVRLVYEAYESMAAREMATIGEEIEQEVPGARLAALHRVGELAIGDVAVICAASAPHRAEAFAACRLLIDRIKQRVPIWKKEFGERGEYWVSPNP